MTQKVEPHVVRRYAGAIMSRSHLLAVVAPLLALSLAIQRSEAAEPASPQPIIRFGGGGWKDGQVNEPIILVNPKDATKLVMFYSGMKLGGRDGAIGKAWANVTEPMVWHEDEANPLLTGDPNIPFEAKGIRLDAVLYRSELDEYWLYYTGASANKHVTAIGLATCAAGDDGYSAITPANLRRHAGNPILSPGGQGRNDESHVSQGAVLREGDRWYSLYSYRTKEQILPGVRLATSSDGKEWIKTPGPDLLTAAPEQKYIEWHQVQKIGDRYVMFFEGYNGGTRWGADVAVSTSLTSGWQKLPLDLIDQTRRPNYADDAMFHVATPAVYRIDGRWRLYFQAAPQGYYINQHWTLWGVECDDVMRKIEAIR